MTTKPSDYDWAAAAAEEPAIAAAVEARALVAQQAAAASLREKELAHMREACRILRAGSDGWLPRTEYYDAYRRWLEADAEPADEPATHDPREEGIR